jgi:pimeloyl-ACP methyl ester carboxylesterase
MQNHFKIHFPSTLVVFLHAFPLNLLMWNPQFQQLKKNRIGYLSFDYPGFGQSSLTQKSMSMEDYADGIYDLLKKMDVTRSVFICSSMGGYVAFALLRKRPGLFRGCFCTIAETSWSIPRIGTDEHPSNCR